MNWNNIPDKDYAKDSIQMIYTNSGDYTPSTFENEFAKAKTGTERVVNNDGSEFIIHRHKDPDGKWYSEIWEPTKITRMAKLDMKKKTKKKKKEDTLATIQPKKPDEVRKAKGLEQWL